MKKLAAALAAMVFLLTGCSKSSVSDEIQLPIYGADEITYEVATAKYMDLSETESIGVSIGYPYAVYLTYPATATVTSYTALKGHTVTEGEVLAVLDSSDLDYDINNQQTIVDAAYESSLTGGEAEQLQYEIELKKLEMLQAEKDEYTIKAPFDGIICTAYAVTEGDEVESGEVCCAVSEVSKTTIYLDNSTDFRFGQTLQIRVESTMYDATVVEASDVAPATAYGASASRVIFDLGEDVMAKIVEEEKTAVSSGWATAFITTERKNVLAVPDSAVKTSGTESTVTVVENGERYKLKVTIGVSLGGYTEILNGISEGDVVLASGTGEYVSAGTA